MVEIYSKDGKKVIESEALTGEPLPKKNEEEGFRAEITYYGIVYEGIMKPKKV